MSFKKIMGLSLSVIALNMFVLSDVNAESVKTKCRVRISDSQKIRSKVSVDGDGLPAGNYYAEVVSADNGPIRSTVQAAVSGEAEFDFDSNSNDILEGATQIAPDFIQDRQVVGTIFTEAGAIVQVDDALCRAKKSKHQHRRRHRHGHD
jgi:hypothetical protein